MTIVEDPKCGFIEAWRGVCDNAAPCSKHSYLRCSGCGSQATRDCGRTFILVCGALLCDDCEHVGDSRQDRHVKKAR